MADAASTADTRAGKVIGSGVITARIGSSMEQPVMIATG